MKKTLIGSLLFFITSTSFASILVSQITLPIKGPILPTKTVSVGFTGMLSNVVYKVSCLIDNPNLSTVALRFSYSPDLDVVSSYTLNDQSLPYGQGALHPSSINTVTTILDISDPKQGSLELRNLDFDNTVNIVSCIATPAVI